MDTNKTPFQFIRDFIEKNEELPDETKQEYLSTLDMLIQNKTPDAELVGELNDYLDKELELMEQAAISDHDSDLVDKLADLRNERTELEKNIFMLYDPEDKEYQESPEVKDKAIQTLLSKISSVANSAPVAVAR